MPLVMGTGGQGMSHAPRAPHAPRDTAPHPRKARLADRGDDAKAALHLSRRPGSNDRRRQQQAPHSARSARAAGGSGGGGGTGAAEGPSAVAAAAAAAAAAAHHHHHQQQQHHGHGHGHASAPPPPQQQQQQQQAPPQFQQGVEPITAPKALARFGEQLSAYEASEVLEYTSVYYCGSSNKLPAPVSGGVNHGYDDERGDYTLVVNDHIMYRFEVLGLLGKGSFGQVAKCLDHKTGQRVAVKIIRNKRKFHKQALIEIRLLQHLKANDPGQEYNVVQMHDYFLFRNHICMVFELHSINIYEFIKLNKFQPLNLLLVKKFTGQLLASLAYLHRENIVHCDLKPENILLKQANRASVKLIDFGSSCFENERLYTYMQSRFYRAPEVILGIPYGRPIDMWSLGCTLAELATGQPLFPGENETEQLSCIMEVMGVPPAKIVQRAPRRKQFFDANGAPRIVANSRGRKRRPSMKKLKDCLGVSDALFVDFVRQCLQWVPEQRMNPMQGLQHPWLSDGAVQQQPPATVRPSSQHAPAHAHPQPQPPVARHASSGTAAAAAAAHRARSAGRVAHAHPTQASAAAAGERAAADAKKAFAGFDGEGGGGGGGGGGEGGGGAVAAAFNPAPPFAAVPHQRGRNPESYLPSIREGK